ncbi:MAG: hypothetical protein LUE17_15500 [Planctomycetaceae bacterium]|nr:hypothetical protein [Planctomycetaceae bacterium]
MARIDKNDPEFQKCIADLGTALKHLKEALEEAINPQRHLRVVSRPSSVGNDQPRMSRRTPKAARTRGVK